MVEPAHDEYTNLSKSDHKHAISPHAPSPVAAAPWRCPAPAAGSRRSPPPPPRSHAAAATLGPYVWSIDDINLASWITHVDRVSHCRPSVDGLTDLLARQRALSPTAAAAAGEEDDDNDDDEYGSRSQARVHAAMAAGKSPVCGGVVDEREGVKISQIRVT